MELGLIFHLGLYSVYAYDDFISARRRKIQNGSEWYLKRLMVKEGDYRTISGWKETQQFHTENYNSRDYFEAEKEFTLDKLNLDSWMELAVSINCKYVIITAKHHDNFCLFSTTTTEHNIMNTPFGKDFLELFIEAARRFNLKVGIYYSWMEFMNKPNKEYLSKIVIPQMNELMRYNVDRYFFDGNWEFNTNTADQIFSNIINKIRDINPNIEINDRIAGSKESRYPYHDINYLGNSTYRTYSDREIPILTPNVPWEHINTIGLSWGTNREDVFKSLQELHLLYTKVKNKGGNLLLNIGPFSDGTLNSIETNLITELAKLI